MRSNGAPSARDIVPEQVPKSSYGQRDLLDRCILAEQFCSVGDVP